MAGTVSFAGTQRFGNITAKPLRGGKVWIIQAGTTSSPQDAFYDPDLTLPLPNPYTLEADARVPFHYLADGQIKVRITDKNGVVRFQQDNILVVGPSSGGGGGVDPTTVIATGDVKARYGTGTLSGFVRLNGRTIGSATSGATERANSDTQALFQFLWGADSSLTVSGGRGVSTAADWSADKTIALPDFRGRVPAALDDMGNSAAGRLTSSYFGAAATTLGATGGVENVTMALANIFQHDHSVFLHDPGHIHPIVYGNIAVDPGGFVQSVLNTGSTRSDRVLSNTTGITLWSDGDNSGTQNKVGKTGSNTAHNTVQRTVLGTFYRKP